MKKVTFSPFDHSGESVRSSMLDVIIALIPASFAGIYFFRTASLLVLLTATFSAVAFEYLSRRIMKRYNTIGDLSAVVTGLLLGLTLPPSTSLPIVIIGSFVGIVVVKQFFGGLGNNIFNPAVAARGFLLIAFSVPLTTWTNPFTSAYVDATTSATPLSLVKNIMFSLKGGEPETARLAYQALVNEPASLLQLLFSGNIAGSLGETSAIAILIGGAYLIFRKRIHTEITFTYLGTAFLTALVIGYLNGFGSLFALINLLSGGLLFGAFFMATDWVTSPMTFKGRVIFGAGLGLLTIIIRLFSNFPEGVLFSILIMNMVTPLIDRHTANRIYGRAKANEN